MRRHLGSVFGIKSQRIDYRIGDIVGYGDVNRFTVHTKDLPSYRYVDLYNAIGAFVEQLRDVEIIESQIGETLTDILHGVKPTWADRTIRKSGKAAWLTGPDEETFLPIDCFWICPVRNGGARYVIRLSYVEYQQLARLELASDEADAGETALRWILDRSVSHSIFRNKILHLVYESGTKDEYGDVESAERLRVLFSRSEAVSDQDIVLDQDVIEVLTRNVVDLHTRRDILKAHGVPIRRGVLLHGPPGTGKTFVCRYLCHRLPETTRIFVTGSSLNNVGALFSLARLLQPSLLFLEDVDLIFSSREINLYSSALGDLLDQMDGLRPHEDVGVVLTTNAIDRLEAAIKDRPGRISQCIHMGAPNAGLRLRYLKHYLSQYDAAKLDLSELVENSDGATQAFLKEWVHRGVQIACERLDNADQKPELCNSDFRTALDEMRRFLDGSDGKIVGFMAPVTARASD